MSSTTVRNLPGGGPGASDHAAQRWPLLRAAAIAAGLHLVILLEWRRDFPPLATFIQVFVLLLLSSWWIRKMVKREGVPRSPVALPLIALLCSVAVSTALSVDPRLSLFGLFGTLVLVLLFFLVCDLLLAGWRAETFVDALLLLGALILMRGLGATVTWYLDWWQARVPDYPPFLLPYRLFGVASHPNMLVSFIYLGLPFAIVRLAHSKWWGAHLAYGAWLLAATVVLFFTRSRGGLVGTAVAVVLTLVGLLLASGLPRPGDAGARLRRLARPLAWVLTGVALFVVLHVVTDTLSPSEYAMLSGGSVSSLGSRLRFWEVAWRVFLAHPLVGSGPMTFGLFYVSDVDAVRYWIANHPHSIYMTIVSEQGLLGTLALVWLMLSGFLVVVRVWRPVLTSAGTLDNPLLIGVPAAFAGFVVHSIVEVPGVLPTNAFPWVMLGAAGLQAAGALQKGQSARARWLAPVLVLPLLTAFIIQRENAAHWSLLEGIVHGVKRDWHAAARALDVAVELDPAFAFYQAERGYAYGVLADSTTEPDANAALRQSLASYEVALRAGAQHVPDLLNAAWLLERAGQDARAEQLLVRAVQRGTDWALPSLLLAERYARQGRNAEAEALFAAAFRAEPGAREMAACRASAACRAAAQRIPQSQSAIARTHSTARALLAAGRARAALDVLGQVPITSSDPSPWLDRAEAHLALGDLAQARFALKVAEQLGARDASRVALLHAALDLANGATGEAIAALERGERPETGDLAYDKPIWRRFGLPGTLLPSLDLLQRTADDLALYRELARLYALEGRESDAAWAKERADALSALLDRGEQR